MKRTFPAIIILISLSILGLILLQKSWFENLLEVTENQFKSRIVSAVQDVANELANNTYSRQLRLPRRGGMVFSPDYHQHILNAPTVSEKFSVKDITAKLNVAFDSKNIKNMAFEFGILNSKEELEMYSGRFIQMLEDTVNYKRILLPIVPESGSELEGIADTEGLLVLVPDYRKPALASLRWVLVGAVVFLIVIIAAFYVTVKSLIDQRKLSSIKSDFINNMTHEFKTPLATISLAVDALRNEKVQQDKEKAKYFSSIIKEENVRMNKHVETILQAGLMERQQLQLNFQPVHVHALITDILDNYQLQLKEKQGEIRVQLNAKSDLIKADEVHFTNMISNLIDNAIKYSKEKPRITISTHCSKKFFIMRVEDNGIGMNKETVKRVFEKFFRAHTGNLHDVKGFGLGMSYVKTVVDTHKGKIKVESTLGKGSAFTIEMPLAEPVEV